MNNPYCDMCAELVDDLEMSDWPSKLKETFRADIARARALLNQQEPKGAKPVVDYSRVPEIATEAQIRSAAQYLVKKRNCDGDLIPAIEYAIARWGRPTSQPVAVSERLPGPDDCDEQGRCWMFGNVEGDWRLISATNSGIPKLKYCFSHWLPANALPTPEANR